MNKSFLALKCVDENNESTWIKHPLLRTRYLVGETLTAKHERLGFYLADDKTVACGKLRVSSDYKKILVVRVNSRDLRSGAPWLDWNNEGPGPSTLEGILKGICSHKFCLSTQRLTVLSEHPSYQLLEEIMKQARKKYKIPFVSHADYIV